MNSPQNEEFFFIYEAVKTVSDKNFPQIEYKKYF